VKDFVAKVGKAHSEKSDDLDIADKVRATFNLSFELKKLQRLFFLS
jgi:hypothetical protein